MFRSIENIALSLDNISVSAKSPRSDFYSLYIAGAQYLVNHTDAIHLFSQKTADQLPTEIYRVIKYDPTAQKALVTEIKNPSIIREIIESLF
ncbi:hypothetical protein J4471_04545 [Candidatus Woesearchaeota archaeon]|nr:hypothetical protein [Candidatus Woesearchaeota archaeon]